MKNYLIHESNLERLEKKMATLQKKCAQSHCSFTYNVLGEEYKTYTNEDSGEEYTAKFYQVEVDGVAQYNGWRFVATLDHHDNGNVIRAYDTELTIPEKYKTCGPTCEHCNRIRTRKDTFLVYNEEKNEFKQVGKTCLQEFTNGLSAENIAFFVSIYEAAEASYGYSGLSYNRYTSVDEFVPYAFECYKHWGYQKSAASIEGDIPIGYRSTRDRASDYFYIGRCFPKDRERLQKEMDEVGFDANSEYAVSNTTAALEWIRNIDKAELEGNEYLRNLYVVASDRYTDYRSLGILTSLTTAYLRHIDQIAAYEKKQKAQEEEKATSNHVGTVGQRLTVATSSFACVSSWSGYYGPTYLYKFTDESGNVFIWYASSPVDNEDLVIAVTGTVKEHSEFNGLKQTVLTRCKVSKKSAPEKEEKHAPATDNVEEGLNQFFEAVET